MRLNFLNYVHLQMRLFVTITPVNQVFWFTSAAIVKVALVNHFYPNFSLQKCAIHYSFFLQKCYAFALCSHLRFTFLSSCSVCAFMVSLWALFLLDQWNFRSYKVIDIVHIVSLPSLILLHCLCRFLFGFLCAPSLLSRQPPCLLLLSCHSWQRCLHTQGWWCFVFFEFFLMLWKKNYVL